MLPVDTRGAVRERRRRQPAPRRRRARIGNGRVALHGTWSNNAKPPVLFLNDVRPLQHRHRSPGADGCVRSDRRGDVRGGRQPLQHRGVGAAPERRIHTRETNYASPDDPAERRQAGHALDRLASHPGLGPRRRAEIRHRERTLRNDGEAAGLSARMEFGPALPRAGHLVRRVADGRG